MSITQDLAEAVTTLDEATQIYQQLADTTETRVDNAINQLESSLQQFKENPLRVEVWLSNDGDDLNSGAGPLAPIKTVREGLKRTPYGGTLHINIANGQHYTLDQSSTLDGRHLIIEMHGDSSFSQGLASGQPALLRCGYNSSVFINGGTVKTSTVGGPSRNTALFTRVDGAATKVYVIRSKVVLSNQALLSGGLAANGLQELGLGYSGISYVAGVVDTPLAVYTSCVISLSLGNLTNTTGRTMAQLISGIVRRPDGTPANVISNLIL